LQGFKTTRKIFDDTETSAASAVTTSGAPSTAAQQETEKAPRRARRTSLIPYVRSKTVNGPTKEVMKAPREKKRRMFFVKRRRSAHNKRKITRKHFKMLAGWTREGNKLKFNETAFGCQSLEGLRFTNKY
jgi:hypothetical protein